MPALYDTRRGVPMVGYIDGRSICPQLGSLFTLWRCELSMFLVVTADQCESFPIARISLRNDPGDNTGKAARLLLVDSRRHRMHRSSHPGF